MKNVKLSLFVSIILMLLITACSSNEAQATSTAPAAQPEVLVAEGRLLPASSQDQAFSIPGQVAEVLVKDSEQVAAGQVLASLVDSPDAAAAVARAQEEALAAKQAIDALSTTAEVNSAQAQLAVLAAQTKLDTAQDRLDANDSEQNQAELDAAQAELNQAKDTATALRTGKGIDREKLAAAEARLTSAQAALASAQALVDAHALKASVGGTVVDLTLQAGQQVAAGTPVMTLADFSAWEIQTDNLTEMEVVGLFIGQSVDVTLDALPDLALKGEITHINARFEEKRGDITYTVTIALTQVDPRMRWGMTAAVHFIP